MVAIDKTELQWIVPDSPEFEQLMELRRKVLPSELFEAMQPLYENRRALFLGAFAQDNLFAIVGALPSSNSILEIKDIVIAPLRHEGFGAEMLFAIEPIVLQKGYSTISIDVPLGAKAPLEHCGYHSKGDPFVFVKWRYINMQKNINN